MKIFYFAFVVWTLAVVGDVKADPVWLVCNSSSPDANSIIVTKPFSTTREYAGPNEYYESSRVKDEFVPPGHKGNCRVFTERKEAEAEFGYQTSDTMRTRIVEFQAGSSNVDMPTPDPVEASTQPGLGQALFHSLPEGYGNPESRVHYNKHCRDASVRAGSPEAKTCRESFEYIMGNQAPPLAGGLPALQGSTDITHPAPGAAAAQPQGSRTARSSTPFTMPSTPVVPKPGGATIARKANEGPSGTTSAVDPKTGNPCVIQTGHTSKLSVLNTGKIDQLYFFTNSCPWVMKVRGVKDNNIGVSLHLKPGERDSFVCDGDQNCTGISQFTAEPANY